MTLPAAVVFIVLSIVPGIRSQCAIDIRTELIRTGAVKEPLFLKYEGNAYNLMIPDNGTLKFKSKGNTAVVACTSDQKPNFLTFNNKTSSVVACSGGNIFSIDNEPHAILDFNECNAVITGSVQNPNSECAQSGSLINIGFQLSAGRGFVNLIDVCYNKRTGSAIYAKHSIPGKAIKAAMKSSLRPSGFKTTEVPKKFNPASAFTKANQLKRLKEIVGADKAKEYLDQTYLARGHLAPDGDFVFVSWQFTTYYYINTVPQWQSINNGNWKHIEAALRSKADKIQTDLKIFTGGFGVLELDGKRITLDSDGLEVPMWSWKVAHDSASDSAIAFLTYNNPFASEAPESLCKDICTIKGWNWKERQTISKGYTVCCEVSDLIDAIPAIPREARATKVMRN